MQAAIRDGRSAWVYSAMRDDPDFAEILQFFVSELSERRELLDDLGRKKDLENLRREAHKLRGSAGGYGFPRLSELAGSLEESCKNAPLDEAVILRNLDDLLDHLGRVRA